MSQAVITKAFVEWKTQQATDNQPVVLDEFIFAFLPGLDTGKPIENTEGIPAVDKIVYRQAVNKTGVVNANSVVYSVTLGADVGDFDFNWIGLVNKASNTLAMIIHAPTQRKVKNDSGQQGNVLVRSMLMEYSGAQTATNITTPAETWQIDFTARLAGIDETSRLANLDIYGAGAFFDNGFLVAKNGAQFFVTQGLGYVGGLRSALAANQNITVGVKPTKVWADVCYQGTLTSAYQTEIKFTVAPELANYTTSGVAHYVFALASIDAAGAITDLRPKGSLADQSGNDNFLRKDQSLSEIKAKGAEAMRQARENIDALATDGTAKASKKLETARKIAGIEFDGTKDIALAAGDIGALPADGTAKAADKLANKRKIAGVEFDGTKDISLAAGDVGALPLAGGTLTGGLTVNATARAVRLSIGNAPSGIFATDNGINIGDSDTGLVQGGDGTVRFYSNNILKGHWDMNGLLYDANIIAGSGLYESRGNVRVYSPNNPPPTNTISGVGWWRCADTGLTMQWGTVGRGLPSYVSFPIAFPGVCVSVQISQNSAAYGNQSTVNISANNRNRGGFQAYVYENEVAADWLAIGY